MRRCQPTNHPADSVYRDTGNFELQKEDRVLLLVIGETLQASRYGNGTLYEAIAAYKNKFFPKKETP